MSKIKITIIWLYRIGLILIFAGIGGFAMHIMSAAIKADAQTIPNSNFSSMTITSGTVNYGKLWRYEETDPVLGKIICFGHSSRDTLTCVKD